MTTQSLQGKKFAILVADGFEQVELTEPRMALIKAGAAVDLVSPNASKVMGFHHDRKGDSFDVTIQLNAADPSEYSGLVLPGGVLNPDTLRQNSAAIDFVRAISDAGKPIAAICHGPWTLIEAGLVKGRQMTSYSSLKTDLRNAGAKWVDEQVVSDRGIITSRNPADLPAFCEKMVEEFSKGNTVLRGHAHDEPAAGQFPQ